jgi:hypothetical protein
MTAKTVSDCQSDAVVLAALIEGIALMDNEGKAFDNARVAATTSALRLANELASDLDRLSTANGGTSPILTDEEHAAARGETEAA